MGSHRAVGRLKGSIGAWVLDRAFDAVGEEALSPAVDQRGFAAFLYEEVTWPHVTFQFGGRVDRTNYEPARRGQAGLHERFGLGRPAVPARGGRRPADDRDQRGASRPQSGARGAVLFRPAPGELRVRGWKSRSRAGARVRVRRVTPLALAARVRRDHLFPERHQRLRVHRPAHARRSSRSARTEFAERFPGRGIGEHEEEGGHGHEEEFPIIEYVGADSILQGIEAHADFQVTSAALRGGRHSTTFAER